MKPELQENDVFWMIHGVGHGAPTFKHKTLDSARAEAARLARNCPGTDFVILRSVEICRKRDVEHVVMHGGHADDGIPF